MLRAKDVMTTKVITTSPQDRLVDVIEKLVHNKISGMPVCDSSDRVVGMISEKDILNFIFSGNLNHSFVKDAMTTRVVGFPPDTELDKISLTMVEKQIRRVPIIENEKLIGIVSRRSIIRTVLGVFA